MYFTAHGLLLQLHYLFYIHFKYKCCLNIIKKKKNLISLSLGIPYETAVDTTVGAEFIQSHVYDIGNTLQ